MAADSSIRNAPGPSHARAAFLSGQLVFTTTVNTPVAIFDTTTSTPALTDSSGWIDKRGFTNAVVSTSAITNDVQIVIQTKVTADAATVEHTAATSIVAAAAANKILNVATLREGFIRFLADPTVDATHGTLTIDFLFF